MGGEGLGGEGKGHWRGGGASGGRSPSIIIQIVLLFELKNNNLLCVGNSSHT